MSHSFSDSDSRINIKERISSSGYIKVVFETLFCFFGFAALITGEECKYNLLKISVMLSNMLVFLERSALNFLNNLWIPSKGFSDNWASPLPSLASMILDNATSYHFDEKMAWSSKRM